MAKERVNIWQKASLQHLTISQKIGNLCLAIWSELLLILLAISSVFHIDTGIAVDESLIIWHYGYVFYFGLISLFVMILLAAYDSSSSRNSQFKNIQDSKILISVFLQAFIGILALLYLVILSAFLLSMEVFELSLNLNASLILIAGLMFYVEVRVWYLMAFTEPNKISVNIIKEMVKFFVFASPALLIFVGILAFILGM